MNAEFAKGTNRMETELPSSPVAGTNSQNSFRKGSRIRMTKTRVVSVKCEDRPLLLLLITAVVLLLACSSRNIHTVDNVRTVTLPPSTPFSEYSKLEPIALLLAKYGEDHNHQLPESLDVLDDPSCRFWDPTSGRKYDWIYNPQSKNDQPLVLSPTTFTAKELWPLKVREGNYRLALTRRLQVGLISPGGFVQTEPGSNDIFLNFP